MFVSTLYSEDDGILRKGEESAYDVRVHVRVCVRVRVFVYV